MYDKETKNVESEFPSKHCSLRQSYGKNNAIFN